MLDAVRSCDGYLFEGGMEVVIVTFLRVAWKW